ncbi:MAG: ASCH domain-containing protein [Agitococcus sp.]|nr:ASCH domain-containing protein [Agitococcus sp.]
MMQPWAWLFINGILRIDDRTWSTAYRGRLWIHASKKVHEPFYAELKKNQELALPPLTQLEQGGLIGYTDLTACLAPGEGDYPLGLRAHGGPGGHYGLMLEHPVKTPFEPIRGLPGIFKVR